MISSFSRYCLFFCFSLTLLNSEIGKSQQRIIDSLERLLANPAPDTQRVDWLNELSKKYGPSNSFIATSYVREALQVSRKNSYKKGEALALHRIGTIHYFRNSYDSAILFYDSALICTAQLGDSMELNRILNNIGQVYFYKGEYPIALEFYLKAMKICENINHREGIGSAMRNIGQLHNAQGQTEKAIEYFEKTREIREKFGDKEGLAQILTDLGNTHAQQHKFIVALDYYQQALKIMEELNYLNGVASITNNIGGMYGEMGEYDLSIKYFQKSLDIYTRAGDSSGAGSALSNIGLVYMVKGDNTKALRFCLRALQLALGTGHRRLIKNTYRDLAKIYRNMGDFRNAFDYYVKYATVKDSLLNVESTKQLAEMQTKYETEKKEKEIEILNKDKKIKESELNRQKLIIIATVAGIILLTGFMALLFNRFYVTRKQKRLIEKQKRMVEEAHRLVQQKNEDILDSIHYAKRIQVALLTGKEYFSEHLPEHFILYKPKDVVSGDFYWGYRAPLSPPIGGKQNPAYKEPEYFTADPSLYILLKEKAEEMKNHPTEAEKITWELLRANKIDFHIRRQHIIGNFIVDFVNIKTKTVIEIDGDIHDYQREEDAQRTEWLEENGFEVLRFRNEKVIGDPDGFCEEVKRKLTDREQKVIHADLNSGETFSSPYEGGQEGDKVPPQWGGFRGGFYLTLADCTGHGVPGAFMSLLGISFLNELIIEKKISSPDAVLNTLRSEIIHSLNPEGREDIQDGMDMVLCRFDFDRMTVEFAGANSGLWIVRNNELTEYGGDDMPIGAGLNTVTPFTLTTIPLQKNDTIYMFTDGFRDQHGGAKGKKLGRKGLRELIIKNSSLPMNTQGTLIEEEFEKWKGINEQTDDVTVIGIRV